MGLHVLASELNKSVPPSASKKGQNKGNKKTNSNNSDSSEYLLDDDDQGGSSDDDTELSDEEPIPLAIKVLPLSSKLWFPNHSIWMFWNCCLRYAFAFRLIFFMSCLLFNIWSTLQMHIVFVFDSILHLLERQPSLQRRRDIPKWLQELGTTREWGQVNSQMSNPHKPKEEHKKGLTVQRQMSRMKSNLQMVMVTQHWIFLHLGCLIMTAELQKKTWPLLLKNWV